MDYKKITEEAERNCYSCAYFSELKEPRELADDAAIYGYCFKDGTKEYSPNMGKGYPVYLPESGVCKSWKRRKADKLRGEKSAG